MHGRDGAGLSHAQSMESLSPARWRKLLDLFELCLRVPPLDRGPLLAVLCPDDDEVREQVADMSCALDADPEFMNTPAPGVPRRGQP